MDITVSIKQIYGNRTIYPVCEKAKLFARLAGQKTLTQQSIETIRNLGYSINVQQEAI